MRNLWADKRVGGVRLVGYSLAGEETVVAAPELNVCFDVGRMPSEVLSIDHVCLSHGHMDHAAGIAYYFSQRAFVGNEAGTVLLHHQLVSPLKRILGGWAEMEGHPSPANIVGMAPGDEHTIRRGMVINAFGVNHGGGALGFTLIESRHKLKPEFAGRTGPQLVDLKKKGVQIEYHVRIPLISYLGDTAVGRWLEIDEVRTSHLVILECTFYEKAHVRRARQGKHLHVHDLPEVMHALQSRHVVLTHVTRRTSIVQAKRTVQETLSGTDLERIEFLMDRPPRRRPRLPEKNDELRLKRSQ